MQYQDAISAISAISGHPPFWTGHHDVNYSTLRGRGCSNNISAPAPVQAVRVKKQAQRRYEKREQLGEGEEHQAV